MGIIAAIIAAVKGHTSFAWIIGGWTVIAVILLFSGVTYALAPGPIFFVYALTMSNERKAEKERNEELKRKEEAHRLEMQAKQEKKEEENKQ